MKDNITDEQFVEPLLRKNKNKFTLFPIKYPEVYKMYKKQEQAFWTAEEIDFSADIQDYNKLTESEQKVVNYVLAFFAGSDGIIFENINCNFSEEIEIPEIRLCYGFQAMMEGIHSECYSLMIDTFIQNNKTKQELFNAIEEIPAVKKKAEWACKWLNKDILFAKRLIAFAIIEGIFFAGSFCVIFWLKATRSLMTKAFAKSNELIARDESLHTDFSVLLYSYIENKLSEEEVHEIFKEAFEIEKEFICDSIQCNLLGMNSEKMIQYIKFVSDRLLVSLGYTKLFNVTCPFNFMNNICLDGKTNFFENRVTEYNRAEQINGTGLNNIDILDDF